MVDSLLLFLSFEVSVQEHFSFFFGNDCVPAADLLAFVFVEAGVGQTGILVALKGEDRGVHYVAVENTDTDQQLEVGQSQAGHAGKELSFQLSDNVVKGLFSIIGEIHKNRNPGGKLYQFFLNHFAFGLDLFFLVGQFLLFLLGGIFAFFGFVLLQFFQRI